MKVEERWVVYTREDRLDCPCCGADVHILTNISQDEIDAGMYQDGDSVECKDPKCDLEGGYVCVDEYEVSISGDW